MSSPDLFAPTTVDAAVHPPPPALADPSAAPANVGPPSATPASQEALNELLRPPPLGAGQTLHATPYPHQVGGHGQLKKTLNGQLLKPLYEKELRFYSYIHSDRLPENLRWLRETTPKFFGRSVAVASSIPPSDSAPAVMSGPRNGPRLQWRMHSSPSLSEISPWAHAMGNRVRKKKSSHRPHSSIALEDLNQSFIFPSVLDLKIGTRHYDDDATEEKRARHRRKSEMTTSAEYGIRFTGMQSYKRLRAGAPGVLEFRDKYYGRKLKGDDLVPQTTWFFNNGVRVRVDCIRIILEKLRHIYEKVRQQTHFKFYSSSLLLVYEGASKDLAPCNADVRMIDFAHTQWLDTEAEPDKGYILGIENLIRILKQVVEESERGEAEGGADGDPPVGRARSSGVGANAGRSKKAAKLAVPAKAASV